MVCHLSHTSFLCDLYLGIYSDFNATLAFNVVRVKMVINWS